MFSPLEQFDVVISVSIGQIIDGSLANVIMPFSLTTTIICVIMYLLNEDYMLIPTPVQKIFESVVNSVSTPIKQQVGVEGYIYFSIISTFFNLVLLLNHMSMLPFGIALTSHIIVTM
jgi:F0F1-type ATP synthase membrane subunit a